MRKIEVEFIGEITKNKFKELKYLFEKEGKFQKLKKRLSLLYFRNKISKDIADIKDEMIDLKFRVTNKKPEIVLKYGKFSGSHARKEIILPIKSDEIDKYIEFLNLLGWHLGFVYNVFYKILQSQILNK